MKRSVAVTIAGQSYALKSDADAAYVQSLAEFVDAKLGELQKRRSVPANQAAILVALQIADELFREREGRAALRHRVKSQARRLLDELAALESRSDAPSVPSLS